MVTCVLVFQFSVECIFLCWHVHEIAAACLVAWSWTVLEMVVLGWLFQTLTLGDVVNAGVIKPRLWNKNWNLGCWLCGTNKMESLVMTCTVTFLTILVINNMYKLDSSARSLHHPYNILSTYCNNIFHSCNQHTRSSDTSSYLFYSIKTSSVITLELFRTKVWTVSSRSPSTTTATSTRSTVSIFYCAHSSPGDNVFSPLCFSPCGQECCISLANTWVPSTTKWPTGSMDLCVKWKSHKISEEESQKAAEKGAAS